MIDTRVNSDWVKTIIVTFVLKIREITKSGTKTRRRHTIELIRALQNADGALSYIAR